MWCLGSENTASMSGSGWPGKIVLTPELTELVERKATFIVNHSGGKDSQAMLIELRKVIPEELLLIIHAELPEVDWPGILDLINATRDDIPFVDCRATKTFFEMVKHRQEWPSPKYRQCTSDLKRGPIERTIRQQIKERGLSGLIVNCVGIRAEESSNRAKAKVWQFSERNSKAGREWYEWLPIHQMLETDVFASIAAAGQEPHWAYGKGMRRLSCVLCIMASKSDLRTGASLMPDVYSRFVEMEKEIDRTMTMPAKNKPRVFLEELTGIYLDGTVVPPKTKDESAQLDLFDRSAA